MVPRTRPSGGDSTSSNPKETQGNLDTQIARSMPEPPSPRRSNKALRQEIISLQGQTEALQAEILKLHEEKETLQKENTLLHHSKQAAELELTKKLKEARDLNKMLDEDILLLQKSNEETEALLEKGQPALHDLKLKLIEAHNTIARYKALSEIKDGDQG